MIDIISSINYIYPEILIIFTICLIFLEEAINLRVSSLLAIIGLIFSIVLSIPAASGLKLFSQTIATDPFLSFFRILFFTTGIITIIFSINSKEIIRDGKGEYYAFILVTILGMSLLASSTDLLMIYISLEIVSLNSYILTGFLRGDKRGNEAALKYLIYGAISSGIMIYGISLLFGITGSTNIYEINKILLRNNANPLLMFLILIFILSGFAYKIAAVPFHFWCPDVYEGAPIPVTAFLSVGPKAAGFAIMIRFFYTTLSHGDPYTLLPIGAVDWPFLLSVISALTMTLGNFAAIPQTNMKRLLAYSSIAHAGYILMGLVSMTTQGFKAMLFYLVVYLFMNFGAFVILMIIHNFKEEEDIEGFKGLGWSTPFIAIPMSIFLFSLTGLPPFAGFIGKFYLFAALINKELYWLAIIGILNSVVSLYYYTRIIKVMFLDIPSDRLAVPVSLVQRLLIILLVIPTILFGIYWTPIFNFTESSLRLVLG